MNRREALIALLEAYRDLVGSCGGGLGGRVEGDAILLARHDEECAVYSRLRCSCWRRSLDELERSLARLRAESVVQHAHLVARYRDCDRVQRNDLLCRFGVWAVASNERVVYPDWAPGSMMRHTGRHNARVVRWPAWVDLLIVAAALERLDELFEGEVSPAALEVVAA